MGFGDVLIDGTVLSLAEELLQHVDHFPTDYLVILLVFSDHACLKLSQLLLGLVSLALELKQLGRDELDDFLALADLGTVAVFAHLSRPFPGLVVSLALVKDLQLLSLDQVGALPLLCQP